MEVKEKKELRMQKLKEMYDFNDTSGGREAQITFKDLHANQDEKYEHLAYEYLAEKGLITYYLQARNLYRGKITSYGIDHVESED